MKLALALALTGCASAYHESPRIKPDPSAPAWFNASASAAASQWTVIGCTIEVAPDDPDATPVLYVYDWDFGEFDGWYDPEANQILIRASASYITQRRMMLHEMGHMLGFEHRNYGIMKPNVTSAILIPEDCPQ